MLITKYTGKDKMFYPDSDIVIATDQKAGVGFDWDDIECIVMATDMRDLLIQRIGRLFRKPDGKKRIIVDFCDDFHLFENHLCYRKRVYEKLGVNIIEKGFVY